MIETRARGRTLTVFLNHPEKRNCLSEGLIDALTAVFESLKPGGERHGTYKCLVLAAHGSVFSAGADLDALSTMQHAGYDENLADSQKLAALFALMYTCELPIVGRLHGHAIAGGCGLAVLCDIRLAAEEARFGYSETRIGFVPALVSAFLIRAVGDTQARRLLLGGELITATEAHRIGLVTECVASGELDNRVAYWTHLFETDTSGEAVTATKAFIREVHDLSYPDFLEHAAWVNARARLTSDCKTGIRRFINKETQQW